MRGVRVTERGVALVCAIVLATMSVVAVGRHNSWWQAANDTATDHLQNNSDNEDSSTQSSGSSDTNQSSQQQTNSSGPSNTGEQGKYTYTAVAGSSYTEFARKAIDAYVLAHNITVQPADRLNAEVALTNAAGAPLLEIGQSISIAQSDVASSLRSAGVAIASSSATTQPSPTTSAETSSFVAIAGSSYTEFARQCVATYSQRVALTMTPAQRIAAETYVVQQVGAPLLDVGQQVTIRTTDVQQAVERAGRLTSAEQTAWQPYADLVAW